MKGDMKKNDMFIYEKCYCLHHHTPTTAFDYIHQKPIFFLFVCASFICLHTPNKRNGELYKIRPLA